MDNNETGQAPATKKSEVRYQGIYKKGNHKYCSATVNTIEGSEFFAKTLKDLPQTAFRVWFGMQRFMRAYNYINVRLTTLAEFCGLSLTTIHRSVKHLEVNDLIVRLTPPNHDSVWMANPQWIWNGHHGRVQRAKGYYFHRKIISRDWSRKAKSMNDCSIIPVDLTEEMNFVADFDRDTGEYEGFQQCVSK